MKRFSLHLRKPIRMDERKTSTALASILLHLAFCCWALLCVGTAVAQDCLEPCDCHPLYAGFGVELVEEATCAPFATSLAHTIEPISTAGYSFLWHVSGGDYTWTGGASATDEFPSIEFLESGVYEVELTVVDISGEGCTGTSGAALVAVAGEPEVTISDVPELCAGVEGTIQVLVNPGNTALTSFAWGVESAWDTLAFPAPLIQAFGSSGSNEVVAWASNACGSHADTVEVTVYPTPALSVSSSHSWYCMGSYVDFVAEGDGEFTWSSNSELLQGGQTGDLSARYTVGSQVLGSVYTTVDHGAVQCATSVGFNAYGFFVPSISISADDVACAGEAVDFEANITSYGWDTSVEWIVDEIPADTVWAPMSSTTTSTGFVWEGEPVAGSHTVEAALVFDPYPAWLPDYGCADTAAHEIEVVPLPVVQTPSSWAGCDQLIAEEFPIASPEGGWWTTLEDNVLNEWVPGAFGLGAHEVVYTYEDAYGCQSSDSLTLEVAAPVQATAGLDTVLCESTELMVLGSAQEGGSWSGPGIADANTGMIDLAELLPGHHDLVYHFGEGSCATTDTMVWEVLENPTVFLSTEGSLACDGDTVWLEAFAGGGTIDETGEYQFDWSSDVNFGTSGDPFVIANASASMIAVDLMVTDDAGCQDDVVAFVTPITLPDATAPALDATCNQDYAVSLPTTEGVMGGWSGPGVNETANTFNPAEVGEGEVDLVYTVIGAMGCVNTDTVVMSVSTPPVVSAGPSVSVCANAAPIELAGFEPAGGAWDGSVELNADQTVFDPAATGVGTHVLVYTVGTASCAVSDSMAVEVTALPELTALNNAVVCAGDTAFGEVAIEGATDLALYTFVWEAPAVAEGDSPWKASAGPLLVPGAVMAFVAVTDSLGCESLATLQWEVQALPEISVQSEWSVCANEGTVEFPVATPDNGVWAGTGVESGLFNASAVAEGTHTLTYAVIDETGCANEAELPTEVVAPIEFDLGPKVHACENQGLVILPTPAELAGFWEGLGLSAETADAVDLSLVQTGTHTYAFVHAGEMCTVSSDLELEVHAKPELAVVSDDEVCPDSVLVMEVDVQAAAFPLAVEWSIDEITVPGNTTVLNVLWPTDGTHAVAVSATDDWGCSNSMDWEVVVLEVSSVDAVESLVICNQAIPVDLSDYAVASEVGTTIFTGVGTAVLAIDSLDFLHPETLEPGDYGVQCTFVPETGCAARDTIDLIVGAAYQVLAGPDTAACASNVQLELAAENGSVAVTWSAVDAPASAVLDASTGLIDVQALGLGAHSLAVEAGLGSCATQDTLILEVVPVPELDFSMTASHACLASELLLTVDALNADAVEWNWANQSVSSDSMLFEPAEAGTVEFEVFAYDAESGCSSSAPWPVMVYAAPEFEVFSDVDAGCSPLQVVFSAEGIAGSSDWNWVLDGAEAGAEATLEVAFETVDTLHTSVVGVTLVDDNGCAGFSSKEIEVWPQPNASISLADEAVCGFPADVEVSAVANVTDEVQWNVNGEWMATGDTASIQLLSLGWHTVEAVLTNAWGCSQVAVDSIEALPLPSAALSAEPMMGCGPLEVQLNAAYGEVESTLSLWQSGVESPLPVLDSVLVLNQPGAYQLTLHVVDERGCENSVELTDSISVFPSPYVDFEANPYAGTFENPDPLNSSWTFGNLSDAGEALWDFGDGTLSTTWDGTHTYDQPGTYAVHVLVVNAFGCEGEAMTEVEVEENLQVFVPNAFTPPTNGYSDGVNDGWRPEISVPELVDSYWLRVFNRYGQLIWESHDPEEYWIGQAGQESTHFGINDAYTWVLRVESRAQRPAQQEWRGHVTLIR